MRAEAQTKARLIAELALLHQHVKALEAEAAERRQTEVALRASEAHYRDLFENATDVIATFTLDGTITNANRAAELLLGWSREEMIGQHIRKVASSASVALEEERTQRFLAGEKLSPTFEAELIRKDGGLVPVEARTRVLRDHEGKPNGFHGIFRDLTERKRTEAALRESEERYRLLFDKANDGLTVLQLSPEGKPSYFIDVNEVTCQRLGYTRDELLQRSPIDILTAENAARVPALAAEMLRTGHVLFEAEHVTKDGHSIPVEINVHLFDLHSQLIALAIARDITERKRAEKQSRRYRLLLERYQTIFALSPDFIYLTDTTGKILDANPALLERTGLSLEHLQQMHFLDFFAGDSPEELVQHLTRLQEGYSVRGLEVKAKSTSGETFTYEVNAISLKENGEVTAILSLARDITTRKHMEDQLKEEAEIAAALARVGQEMIASLNTPVILERLCRLTTEVLGCDCSHTILWQPEDNAYVAAAGYGDTPEQWEARRVLKVPSEWVEGLGISLAKEGMVEVEVMTPQASAAESVLRQFEITAELYVALRHGPRLIGTQSAGYRGRRGFSPRQKRIAQGIAQIASLALANARLLEELERSNRLKEDFIGAMSHELRTPLNILLGYTEMLRDETCGSLTPEQANILVRMDKNAQELFDLVNATLDLSRLQSQRVPLARQDVWVSKLLTELETETHQLNRKPALQLEWQVAADLPVLYTDVVKLKMVLKNVILNALKFTEEGTVTVTAAPRDEGIIFVVADTGPGIPPEVLPSIFEPFHQGENFTTPLQGGVGLGLYIVRQLLTLLGGTVSVESEVGRGSTFRVWMPKETPVGGQS